MQQNVRPVLQAVPNPAAPRTTAVHLRVGTSLRHFISGDPKASCTLKSVKGLYCFEAIAIIGLEKEMLNFFGFIRCAQITLKAFGPASTAGWSCQPRPVFRAAWLDFIRWSGAKNKMFWSWRLGSAKFIKQALKLRVFSLDLKLSTARMKARPNLDSTKRKAA